MEYSISKLREHKVNFLDNSSDFTYTYIHTHYLTTPSRGLFRGNGNKYKQNRNLLRIPAGGRLISWLFTKRGGVEFGTTEDKSIQWQGAGFEPVTSGLQVRRPTTRPRLPPLYHLMTLMVWNLK